MSPQIITFDEIQELLHLYFAYFRVNELMGKIGADRHSRIDRPLKQDDARAAVIQYWLDTCDSLRNNNVPESDLTDPSEIADLEKLYKWWLRYKRWLWDPKIHLLTWDKYHAAITIFSAGLQTSHTQTQGEPMPEFLPSTIRGEE